MWESANQIVFMLFFEFLKCMGIYENCTTSIFGQLMFYFEKSYIVSCLLLRVVAIRFVAGMFQCEQTKLCIPTEWICNDVSNCGHYDESDENDELHNCTKKRLDRKNYYNATVTTPWGSQLNPREYMCKIGYDQCRYALFHCAVQQDGIMECPTGGTSSLKLT